MKDVFKPLVVLPLYLSLISCVAPTLADALPAGTITEEAKQVTLPVPAQKGVAPAPAEFPDITRSHWAYVAMKKLSQEGIVENFEDENVYLRGTWGITRYSFAVDVARLLVKSGIYPKKPAAPGATRQDSSDLIGVPLPQPGVVLEKKDIAKVFTRRECNDVITALMMEFSDELARLGIQVGDLGLRVNNGLVN